MKQSLIVSLESSLIPLKQNNTECLLYNFCIYYFNKSMQETEQSEKDMIGSLLDGIYFCILIENESECSEFRSSITKSQQHS